MEWPQQIQKWNGRFRRLKQKQLGIDDILDGENLGEIRDLATSGAASTSILMVQGLHF